MSEQQSERKAKFRICLEWGAHRRARTGGVPFESRGAGGREASDADYRGLLDYLKERFPNMSRQTALVFVKYAPERRYQRWNPSDPHSGSLATIQAEIAMADVARRGVEGYMEVLRKSGMKHRERAELEGHMLAESFERIFALAEWVWALEKPYTTFIPLAYNMALYGRDEDAARNVGRATLNAVVDAVEIEQELQVEKASRIATPRFARIEDYVLEPGDEGDKKAVPPRPPKPPKIMPIAPREPYQVAKPEDLDAAG